MKKRYEINLDRLGLSSEELDYGSSNELDMFFANENDDKNVDNFLGLTNDFLDCSDSENIPDFSSRFNVIVEKDNRVFLEIDMLPGILFQDDEFDTYCQNIYEFTNIDKLITLEQLKQDILNEEDWVVEYFCNTFKIYSLVYDVVLAGDKNFPMKDFGNSLFNVPFLFTVDNIDYKLYLYDFKD